MAYFDTSFAIKYYLPEEGSDAVQAVLAEHSERAVCELMVTEVASVLARCEHEARITRGDHETLWRTFRQHVDSRVWAVMPVTLDEFMQAGELIRDLRGKVSLRALDALHLAVCRRYRLYPLFTHDERMRQAAEALGIPLGACAIKET